MSEKTILSTFPENLREQLITEVQEVLQERQDKVNGNTGPSKDKPTDTTLTELVKNMM